MEDASTVIAPRKTRKFVKRTKNPPITPEERDRLVDEYRQAGGEVHVIPPAGMVPGLEFQAKPNSDKTVGEQMPWIRETSDSMRRTDMDFLSND